jgi:cytidine deaminase
MTNAAETLAQREGELVARAVEARRRAYAPYSGYTVGAALLTTGGQIFTGVNVENAAYPDSLCAERVAVVKAVSEGVCEFVMVAVATSNGGSPCGSCRQVMAEFGLDAVVLLVNGAAAVVKRTTVRELLPDSFGPKQLRG